MSIEQDYEIILKSKPKVRFCKRFKDSDHLWNYEPHSHPHIEMMYFLKGERDETTLGATMYDVVLYPANYIHQDGNDLKFSKEIICLWVEIPELVIEEPCVFFDREGMLGIAFQMIYQECEEKNRNSYFVEMAVKFLLSATLREVEKGQQKKSFANRIARYIQEHYKEKIMVKDLAEMEHVSETYMSRKFKQHMGVSIVHYIQQKRIEEAQRLLIATDCDVNEIAYQVGFCTSQYFFRVFREQVGETPGNFRQKHRQ